MDAEPGEIRSVETELYGASYYASHCGPVPYARNDHWLQFFGRVADELVRSFAPSRMFDAGCALGLLVECFWDRGVEAYGRDVSTFAIDQVRADVRPCCSVGSITEPIEDGYDLVTCIEVLEHMPEQEALQAIQSMALAGPRILFSSSPTDFEEPTHCNVRPPIYWLMRWAEVGFAPLYSHDASYLAPHAYVLERSENGRTPRDLAAFADRVRHRVAMAQLGNRLAEVSAESERRERAIKLLEALVADITLARDHAQTELHHFQGELERDRTRQEAEAGLQAERHASELAAQQAATERERSRTETEQRRLRANAAQRSAEARAEAAQARLTISELQVSLDGRLAELTTLQGRVQAEASENKVAAGRIVQLEGETAHLRVELSRALIQRDTLLSSTVWRASWPLRRLGYAVPALVRESARRTLTVMWWASTGQLIRRLKARRRLAGDAEAIRGTDLFDPGWYAARNPDVVETGTDPALHYAMAGGPEGRDPGPRFSVQKYEEMHPEAATARRPALLHFLEVGRAHGWMLPQLPSPPEPVPKIKTMIQDVAEPAVTLPAAPSPPSASEPPAIPDPVIPDATPPLLDALVRARFGGLEPLRTYAAPHDMKRVTIVTDSINTGSLYGGVGTALILATLLAERVGAGLRLVTRTEAPAANSIGTVLGVHGVDWPGNIEFIHAPPGAGRDVPVGPQDIFLTTSWWTTWATRRTVAGHRIVYLLQEDERGFYPLGDDHLRCSETLSDPTLSYVVNSSLLLNHLQAEGLAPGAVAFEPAFPPSTYYREERAAGAKANFFFYARPNNPRNLFWRGIEVIGAALEEGILDPTVYDIHFVGKDIPPVQLPGGVRPVVSENMAWNDYASLVRRMDLGLSLMDTPHPSYPPLDLAASGAVVVTNRFGPKVSLESFSPNILAVDSTVPALVEGLRQARALAADPAMRRANYDANRLGRDWSMAMKPALDRLAIQFGR